MQFHMARFRSLKKKPYGSLLVSMHGDCERKAVPGAALLGWAKSQRLKGKDRFVMRSNGYWRGGRRKDCTVS